MVGLPSQRTTLDILASKEVDAYVHNKGPFENVRDRTMHVIIAVLDLLVGDGNKVKFSGDECPDVPLEVYLQRFFKYTPCKKDAFIASLIYLDRKITKCGMVIDSSNIHRLFLTSSLTAAKLVEDVTADCAFNNKLFAIVGGVPLTEMNELEMEFLEALAYRVHIFPCEFHQYSDAVNSKVSLLREEYLKCSGLETDVEASNCDESSSARMIYSLIFDSCQGNAREGGVEAARETAPKAGRHATNPEMQRREGACATHAPALSAVGVGADQEYATFGIDTLDIGSDLHPDEYKVIRSQTSREFPEVEKDACVDLKKSKRRRNKKKHCVAVLQQR